MPQSVRAILFDMLQRLERSTDPQVNDPAVMKLRDDIAMAIFRLHAANEPSEPWEAEERKAA